MGEKWGIKFNSKKSQVIHFRKQSKPLTEFNFKLGEELMELVNEYKYLGVMFNEYIDVGKMITVLANSGNRALGCILNKFNHLNGLTYNTYKKLFFMCVAPILDYSAASWGNKQFSQIDSVQNKAMKFFVGAQKTASTAAVYCDMDWVPCNVRRKIQVLKFWNKLCQTSESRLLRKVFDWDYHNKYRFSWCKEIENLLSTLNLHDSFLNKTLVDINQCKSILCQMDRDNWKTKITTSPKLRTYCTFKENPHLEPYVYKIKNRQERSLLAKLRFGTLPLQVEIGRWQNIKFEDRVCPICHTGVEDENHLVFYCSGYNEERYNFENNMCSIQKNWRTLLCPEKFVILMQKENILIFTNFLSNILAKRKSYLSH